MTHKPLDWSAMLSDSAQQAAPSSDKYGDASSWQTSRAALDLSRPLVMGIVNVTPDSFFQNAAGATNAVSASLAHAERLVIEGVDILDIGGESSRPGAPAVPVEEELKRVLPVLKGALKLGVTISVDTRRAEVMRAALDLGVDIVNDIQALQAPGALDVIAQHPSCGVCLMHMRGEPLSMQNQADYTDVVAEILQFWQARLQAVRAAGIDEHRVVLDPGIGFAKTPEHNLELLRRQPELLGLGRPLLLGWSRKSTLGHLTGRAVDERLAASMAAALAAVSHGARVIRVHDVAATVDAIKVWAAAGLIPQMNTKGML
jgi:dihydropteroate synthase